MAFDKAEFGTAASLNSLGEVSQFIRNRPVDRGDRQTAAAYGMFLVASEGAKPDSYFEDALALLHRLAVAKAELDAAAHHELLVADITASILRAAQHFIDEATVPCTEWPSTEEIAGVVYEQARSFADT
jgi:hypothetical protein